MRYMSYFAVIVGASALTQALTAGIPNASNGGMWMFLSATVIVFGGALGTLFYANLRNEVIERVRHYVFGISVLPGLLVAVFLRATREFLGGDAFGGTLEVALPIVFLCTVILPALVFIKELAGIRTLHRSRMDDQEAMALWTRQDGIQR
jgi:heme/copper-type cytochrome/quinol oxidase subunit 3